MPAPISQIADCDCPQSAVIPTLLDLECPFVFDQMDTFELGVYNPDGILFDQGVNAIETEASHDTYLAANDDTKLQFLHNLANIEWPQGTFREFGGNTKETPRGRKIVLGPNPIDVTGEIHYFNNSLYTSLKNLECYNSLGLIIYDKLNNGIAWYDSVNDVYTQIPVFNFKVGDPIMGQGDEPNRLFFSFQVDSGWFEFVDKFKPDFSAIAKKNTP